MRRCISCGRQLEDQAKFCDGCGARQQILRQVAWPHTRHKSPRNREGTSTAGRIIFVTGFALVLWGVGAIAVAAGLLKMLSIVQLATPIGIISTDDPHFEAGLLLAATGVILMYVSERLNTRHTAQKTSTRH